MHASPRLAFPVAMIGLLFAAPSVRSADAAGSPGALPSQAPNAPQAIEAVTPAAYAQQVAALGRLRLSGNLSPAEFKKERALLLEKDVFTPNALDKLPVNRDWESLRRSVRKYTGPDANVVIAYVVGSDGRVRDAHVESSNDASCAAEAMQYLGTCRFDPGIKEGRAVSTRVQWRCFFRSYVRSGQETGKSAGGNQVGKGGGGKDDQGWITDGWTTLEPNTPAAFDGHAH